MNNRKYNATFILDTRGYTEPVETLIETLKETIQAVGATVISVENMGQKTFTRAVDRTFPAGIYVSFDLEAPASFTEAINEKLKLDKTVNRVMILAK